MDNREIIPKKEKGPLPGEEVRPLPEIPAKKEEKEIPPVAQIPEGIGEFSLPQVSPPAIGKTGPRIESEPIQSITPDEQINQIAQENDPHKLEEYLFPELE